MKSEEFKVGDYVEALWGCEDYFSEGARGTVRGVGEEYLLVNFQEGEYSTVEGDPRWYLNAHHAKKVNSKGETMKKVKSEGLGKKKSEGEGVAIQAWAVEVDGEVFPESIYSSRSAARSTRNMFKDITGQKAVTRKVQIQVLKGKI